MEENREFIVVGWKSEACYAVNNVTRKFKKHESGKDVWRTRDQGTLCREGAPLMISGTFAVALSWMHIIIRRPIIKVPLLRSTTKRLRSIGSHFSSLFFNMGNCVGEFIALKVKVIFELHAVVQREGVMARSLALSSKAAKFK